MIANSPSGPGLVAYTYHWLTTPICLLITVMLLSGSAGGCARYVLSKIDDRKPLYQEAFLGAVAAFIVPAFLSLIQSRIVSDTLTVQDSKTEDVHVINLTIVAGFCIAASYTARQFLENLSSRLLQQQLNALWVRQSDNTDRILKTADAVDDLKDRQAESAQDKDVSNVVEGDVAVDVSAAGIASTGTTGGSPVEEPSEKMEDSANTVGGLRVRLEKLSPINFSIMREFWNGQRRRRSVIDIAHRVGLELDLVEDAIARLVSTGFLIKIPATETTSGLPRYYLSGIGFQLTDKSFQGINSISLPKNAEDYIAAIGKENAEVMRSKMHLGEVRGGILGRGTSPNFQITTPLGVVHRFRSVRGAAVPVSGESAYEPNNLSDVLNTALAA